MSCWNTSEFENEYLEISVNDARKVDHEMPFMGEVSGIQLICYFFI